MSARAPSRVSRLIRGVLLIIAVLLLVPLLLMLFMMPMMGMMSGMGGMEPMMSPAWGLGMMLVAVLVLLGVVYAIYRTVAGTTRDPALEELRTAYARGELSQDEFEQRQTDLKRTE